MLRPPLSAVTNPQNHILKSPYDSQDVAHSNLPSSKRKHVMFDPSAILLAEKHETNPSTRKKRKYGETLDLLKSASSWDKFSLQRFAVDFKKTDYTPLSTLINDPKWYDPSTADEPWFMARYDGLVKASMAITEEILREWDFADSMTLILLGQGPLEYLIPALASLLTTDSQESKALETTKSKQEPKIVHHPLPASVPVRPTSPDSERPCTPTQVQPRFPQSMYQTPTNQRIASDSSFGTKSTETTPNKLVHAEPKVQALQNKFVECILNKLWAGRVDLSWVKGRRMSLIYSETSPTSFQYTVRQNEEQVLIGRVKAIADGCLRLKTNKRNNPKAFCYWSKQKAALSFEAKKVNTDWVDALKAQGKEPADAVAEARAGQILAEMLGMVCHPEYYQDSTREQTAIIVHFDGFHVSIFWATFPSEYLHTIRDVDINLLKHREEKIKLNHSRRYSLLDTMDRTDFIKEFVALLRFVAAGDANVGFLRKDGVEIHRKTDVENVIEEDEQVLCPPQEEMEEVEEISWRAMLQRNREEYTS